MDGQHVLEERPYLQTSIAEPHEARFRTMGYGLQIVSNSRSVIEAAEASFGLFAADHADEPADFLFRLHHHEIDDGLLGDPIFRCEGPLVYQTTGRDSVLVADREQGLAYGYFSGTTLADQAFFRWHFLDLALYFMVEWRGLLGIHGAAICRDGRALLLRAPSGQGKTTLAYAGARARFQALAEDVVWVDLENDLLWGFPAAFHLLPDARELFPELKPQTALVQLNGERKLAVDMCRLRAEAVVTSGRPGPVVMLRRVPGEASRLERIGLEEAYGEWLAGCSSKEQELPDYRRKIQTLLGRGAYRLRFGDDIEAALDLLEPLLD